MEVENLKTHVKVSGSRSGGITADSSVLDDLRREVEAIRRDASEAKRTANRTADKLRRPTGVDVEGTSGTMIGFEHSSIITRLIEDVGALKAASQGTIDIGQLTRDVRCLKYECRGLKDQATLGGAGFMTASDGSGLEDMRRDVQDLQRRVKDVELSVPSADTLAESIMLRRQSPPIVTGDVREEVERLREEVGKLRRSGATGKGKKSIATFMETPVDLQETIRRLGHDVRCLKAEVKRLFAVTPGEGRTDGVDNLIRVISDEVLVTVRRDVDRQLRCVKHELRKVRAGPGAELALMDRDVGVTEASSALIEELRRDIDNLRMQISLAGSGGGVSQVFVDLPQTAAVQLVFRAQQEGDDAG
jgi:hypothetical protein